MPEDYPRTIDNGAGERLTFLRRDGDRCSRPARSTSSYIEPADNIEYFLGAIFESQRRKGGGGLLGRYGKYADAPEPVRR